MKFKILPFDSYSIHSPQPKTKTANTHKSSNSLSTPSNPHNQKLLTPKTNFMNDISEENEEKFLSNYHKIKEKKKVSSLLDNSLKVLQNKEGYIAPFSIKTTEKTEKSIRQRAQTSTSQLRLSTETAEYHDDYYLGGKQKYQLQNSQIPNGYKTFTQNYVKNCFDKEGNLLFPLEKQGISPQNLLQPPEKLLRERLRSDDLTKHKIMTAKQEEKKFLNNIEKKIKKADNEAFIVTIMKDLAKSEFQKPEKSERISKFIIDESRIKYVESIKNNSLLCLQEAVKHGKTLQNFKSAQVEIEKNYKEMKKVIEETVTDQ